jgi:hypothetical protein
MDELTYIYTIHIRQGKEDQDQEQVDVVADKKGEDTSTYKKKKSGCEL